jgi:hypothetical protein
MADETSNADVAEIARAAGELRATLDSIRASARGIAGDLAEGLKDAVVEGERLDEVLAGIATRLSDRFLDQALRPLEKLVAQGVGAAAGGLAGAVEGTRNLDAAGANRGDSAAGGVSVTLHVTTPDAEGFRRSEAQVSAMLARAVGRGRRGL